MGNFGNSPLAQGRTTGWIWQFAKEASYAEEGSVERHAFDEKDVVDLLQPEGREADARGFLVTTDGVRLHIPERMVLDALSPAQMRDALRGYWRKRVKEISENLAAFRAKREGTIRVFDLIEEPGGARHVVFLSESNSWRTEASENSEANYFSADLATILDLIDGARALSFPEDPAPCRHCDGKGALDDRGFALRGQVFFETQTCRTCKGKGCL